MVRSRVFVFLAIALFLAGCLCAEVAAGAAADRKTAVEKVKALKELTARVLDTAQTKFRDAESAKSDVEDYKRKADTAESVAKRAAAEITAKERKTEAEDVAQEAQKELVVCLQLYNAAKVTVDQAYESLNDFVTRAVALDNKAKDEILPVANPPEDYTKVIKDAATATNNTQTLSGEIGSSTVLTDANAALLKLQDSAKKVQVFKYQAESIAIVSNIESMLKTVETDIQTIQEERDKINVIVQEMEKTFESAPDSLKGFFSSLCNNAGGFLRIVTKRVTEAQKWNETMLDWKTQIDKALKTLKTTNDESDAKTQFGIVKWRETSFADELRKIKQALGAAVNYVSTAKSVQQQMQKEMSQYNSQSGSGLNNKTPSDNVRTTEVTNPIPISEEKNPKITETDKKELGKSKDTKEKTSEQPVDAHLDKAKENKSTQVTDNEKQNTKDDNSKLFNNDKLRNITKNMTNNSLISGEVPKRSAANDSAVTVFIPLLVILVMFAVLH